jgi:hypothetical protein
VDVQKPVDDDRAHEGREAGGEGGREGGAEGGVEEGLFLGPAKAFRHFLRQYPVTQTIRSGEAGAMAAGEGGGEGGRKGGEGRVVVLLLPVWAVRRQRVLPLAAPT